MTNRQQSGDLIVDHFNATSAGGAALAAQRLHDSLAKDEITSRLWCSPKNAAKPNRTSDDWKPIYWKQPAGVLAKTSHWLQNELARWRKKQQHRAALRHRPPGNEYFSFAELGRKTPLGADLVDGDILHLHWVAQFIDYPSFFASLPHDRPIVWTLHDMHPITGGCHHADNCSKYASACSVCPQLANTGPIDWAETTFRNKQLAYAKHKLHFVAPSQWIADAASASNITANSTVTMIRHGVNTNLFQPLDKRIAKQKIGLNPEQFVIGFGADSVNNPRKGMKELREALTILDDQPNIKCLTFGNGICESSESLPPIAHKGFIKDETTLATIYAAADVFVFPTYAESCGMTGVEAMASGTPVVAFNAVGVREYVLHEQTGLVAPLQDSAALAHCIKRLIRDEALRIRLARKAREFVVREFEQTKQARKHTALYKSIYEQNHLKRAA